MKTFNQLLTESVTKRNSLLCVGLDPRASDPDALRRECLRLIDATADIAAIYKPNSAFFEACGAEGIAALREVIAHVPRDIPILLDAKRADIADTNEAYARAAFDSLGATAITVNPYLGFYSLTPFLAQPERGLFVLCKTSNPDADEFQALDCAGRPLYEVVAQHAQQWSLNGNIGLVVGATDPSALARVRELAPEMWLLVPGVGAQGGSLQDAVAAGLRADGMGLLLNASRSIARAADPRAEAMRLRDEINTHRTARPDAAGTQTWKINALARDLLESGCVRFGQFKLKSGSTSPIYLDLRRLVTYPAILQRVARAYAELLRPLTFNRLAGIPYAALPIATAIALQSNCPLIYPRREQKEYGTRASIEGHYVAGENVVVIDDLATTGETKIETIQKLEAVGLRVRDIVVLIDREQGAREMLARAGYRMHAVLTLGQLLDAWQRSGDITPHQFAEVRAYVQSEA